MGVEEGLTTKWWGGRICSALNGNGRVNKMWGGGGRVYKMLGGFDQNWVGWGDL